MAQTDPRAPGQVGGQPPAPEAAVRARGRRIALAVYYTMVVMVGGAAAVQITKQVLFSPGPLAAAPTASPPATCREGLRSLFDALTRAREAAAGSEQGGEDAALAKFRQALDPEWGYRDGVAAHCRESARDAATLDAIERLRYAEEHAVRREAGELAPLRLDVKRKVQAIVDSELGR